MDSKRFFSLVSSFTLGFLLAVVVFNLLLAKKIDNMYFYQRSLKSELEHTKLSLEKLEKDKSALTKHTIKEIKITIEHSKETDKYDIEDSLRSLLKDLIGREIDSLDVYMLEQIIDERILSFEGKKVIVHLKSLIVSKTVIINVSVENIDED